MFSLSQLRPAHIPLVGVWAIIGVFANATTGGAQWSQKADMPTARAFLGTSVMDGRIYAIGGLGGANVGPHSVEEYAPATETWTPSTDMPTPRLALSTSVVDGVIYAFGGADGTAYLRTVEAFEPRPATSVQSGTWGLIKLEMK